jgi:uncharacterized membrane protein (DUF373 family)
MADFVKKFERAITMVLIGMIAVVILLSVADLGWVLFDDVISPPLALLGSNELLDVFGMFLLVLVGIELLETLDVYIRRREMRAEVILVAAMIALARKVITLDVKVVPGVTLVGMAALIAALALAYSLLRRIHDRDTRERSPGAPEKT